MDRPGRASRLVLDNMQPGEPARRSYSMTCSPTRTDHVPDMAKHLLRPVTVALGVVLVSITALLALVAAGATETTVFYRMLLMLLQPVAIGVFVAAAQSRWPLPRRAQRAAVTGLGIHLLVTAGFAVAVATGWTSGFFLSELASSGGMIEFDLSLTLSDRDVMVPATLCLTAAVAFAVLLAMQSRGRQHPMQEL